jgi:hypothetical protein
MAAAAEVISPMLTGAAGLPVRPLLLAGMRGVRYASQLLTHWQS